MCDWLERRYVCYLYGGWRVNIVSYCRRWIAVTQRATRTAVCSIRSRARICRPSVSAGLTRPWCTPCRSWVRRFHTPSVWRSPWARPPRRDVSDVQWPRRPTCQSPAPAYSTVGLHTPCNINHTPSPVRKPLSSQTPHVPCRTMLPPLINVTYTVPGIEQQTQHFIIEFARCLTSVQELLFRGHTR